MEITNKARSIRHTLSRIHNWFSIKYYQLMGVQIGTGCFISSKAHIDARRGKIIIGKNVSIAGGSYILSHVGFRAVQEGQVTVIEDNVRIFVNSVVLPGIKIGNNSIVGAGAIVVKNVPQMTLVMGNPARVVQKLEESDLHT